MKLEIYFDYACPYCIKGYQLLTEILPKYPDLVVEWLPCEAHPRPERHGLHSDLCARGMYIAAETLDDLSVYHEKIFNTIHHNHIDIENPEIVASTVKNFLDPDHFLKLLSEGKYISELNANNQDAWFTHQFSAVPSLVMNGEKLVSVENIGLSRQAIIDFIDKNINK